MVKINRRAYIISMKLSFNELRKREVINVTDAKNLGRIIDLVLDFPKGVLVSITVQGKKGCRLFDMFNKSKLTIPRRDIVKIGGDVILVKVSCGGVCDESVGVSDNRPTPKPPSPCAPLCPPSSQTEKHTLCQDASKFLEDDYEDY